MGSKFKFLGIVLAGLVLLSGSGVRAGQRTQGQRQNTQTVSTGNNTQKTALKGQQSFTSARKGGSMQDQNVASKTPQAATSVKTQAKPQLVSAKKTSGIQDQNVANAKSQTGSKPGKVQRPSRPGVRFVTNRQQGQNVTDSQMGQTQLPSAEE
jgi:hypothetical protein